MKCMEYMEMVKNKGSFNGFLKMCVYENILLAKGNHYFKCEYTQVYSDMQGTFPSPIGESLFQIMMRVVTSQEYLVSVPYRGIIISN